MYWDFYFALYYFQGIIVKSMYKNHQGDLILPYDCMLRPYTYSFVYIDMKFTKLDSENKVKIYKNNETKKKHKNVNII